MKKVVSVVLTLIMLVSVFSTVFSFSAVSAATDYNLEATTLQSTPSDSAQILPKPTLPVSKEFTIKAGTVEGVKLDEDILIPVSFANVPDTGIFAADMTILYDATQLRYIGAEAGNIVLNPETNFAINKEKDGILKLLFIDETQKDEYISTDGVFVNLHFNMYNYETDSSEIQILNPVAAGHDLDSIPVTAIEGAVTTAQSDFKVIIGSVNAKQNEKITVPITFEKIPSGGIQACNFIIKYDPTKLEYLSYEPGSIVPNPNTSFIVDKFGEGLLTQLFLDCSSEELSITSDGIVANLCFNVLGSSGESTSLKVIHPTFGDQYFKRIKASLVQGQVNISGVASIEEGDFTVNVGEFNANTGDTIEIPFMFSNIPQKGIAACDMAISYDSSKLEYVSYDVGGIVKNPDMNFGINKVEDGLIKLLFLDRTMEDEYITSEGAFVTLNFKVVGPYAESTPINFIGANFCDLDINTIKATVIPGNVNIFNPKGKLTLSLGSAEGKPGELVSIPFNLSNIHAGGVNSVDTAVFFDSSKLEYIAEMSEAYIPNLYINESDDGKIKIFLFSINPDPNQTIKKDTEIAKVTFRILEESSESVPVQIDYCLMGYDEFDKEVSVNDGVVNIIGSEGCTVSGYVYSEIKSNVPDSEINKGFKVVLSGTDLYSETDNNGYFKIENVPEGTYTVTITKPDYLKRNVENILVNENIELSKEPIVLWCGDIEIQGVQDDAINFEDIMHLCKVFNTAFGDDAYTERLDLNKDSAINMEDIMIVAKHFNTTPSSYK